MAGEDGRQRRATFRCLQGDSLSAQNSKLRRQEKKGGAHRARCSVFISRPLWASRDSQSARDRFATPVDLRSKRSLLVHVTAGEDGLQE